MTDDGRVEFVTSSGLGSHDDRIELVDSAGVALASIQALHKRIVALEVEVIEGVAHRRVTRGVAVRLTSMPTRFPDGHQQVAV